jgi:signal transduction histidine kinase
VRSITARFIVAFVAVSLISTLLVVFFTRWRSREEFRSFLIDQNRPGIVGAFSDYYGLHGSWDGVSQAILAQRRPPSNPEQNYDMGPFTLIDASSGRVVLAGPGFRLGSVVNADSLGNTIPIQSGSQTVGLLVINRPFFRISPPGTAYLDRINLQIFLGGLLALGLALVLAIALSRNLTRPIRELTTATREVSEGGLGHQVPVRSRDELGQLATSFNSMSADLVRSVELRRKMTADIAHELRTPISIILGHAEAVHDGVVAASPETFEIVREEASRLEGLVEDLRTLSMADAGELPLMRRSCSPARLLADVQKAFAQQASKQQVALQLSVAEKLPDVDVDSQRFHQVLSNVLDNALRYSPPGGEIRMGARPLDGRVEFRISDDGPGIPESELPLIFERFHRVQTARSRTEGGSGLGLAIAKSIVERHGGAIRAEASPQHGLTVVIELDVAHTVT